jgi:hypothetical protein
MFTRSDNPNSKLNWMRVALVLSVGVAWLAQNSYLDMPIGIVKDISIAFPCQFNGCGCKDAVQCWSSCGCHTDAEKIVWAKAHSVQPPQWFLEDLKTKPTAVANVATTSSCGSSCCCGEKAKQPPAKVSADQSDSTVVVYLNLKQRRNCNGQYDNDMVTWYFVSPADRPLPPISISPLCPVDEQSPLAVFHLPATPPPKNV